MQTNDGATFLTTGYKAFVDIAPQSVVFGSGDADELVLSSIGSLNFAAAGGSGTVVAGGGNNRVFIPGSDNGDWSVNTGMGDDFVFAFGGATTRSLPVAATTQSCSAAARAWCNPPATTR